MTRRIRRLLIANRGEIAVRVALACRERDVVPVAVYSDADAGAPHVRACAEAVRIGPAPARESYLNVEAVLGAARAANCDAVHPGYGFLSERPAFAEAVEAAGLVWVGPPAEAQRRMGSKAAARATMRAAGVPVVPGYDGEDDSIERLREAARAVGFPLLVKAIAGGGGKGLRRVDRAEELDRAVESCRREAEAAFGVGRVLLEKLVDRPRHIEVQVLADVHGNVVHLGERECSVQRRHQKVIEEAPSTVVDAALRRRFGDAAVVAARAAGYVNAGTVEFLFDEARGDFYFLEMNTRLQVEHPVTELVYGIDLVQAQLRVAEGERLWLRQEDVAPRGWAIECRLYAENAEKNFLPAPGRIQTWRAAAGPGVRVDHAAASGLEVTPYYDPMIAKVIAFGDTRAHACARMARALADTVVDGLVTNRAFLSAVVSHDAFAAGKLHTGFIAEHFTGWRSAEPAASERARRAALAVEGGGPAAAAAMGEAADPTEARSPWRTLGAWRLGDATSRAGAGAGASANAGASFGGASTKTTGAPRSPAARARSHAAEGDLRPPMPGKVVALDVGVGDTVVQGQRLAVVEAMKMEHPLRTPRAGTVRAVHCRVGDMVEPGRALFDISP